MKAPMRAITKPSPVLGYFKLQRQKHQVAKVINDKYKDK
jgi:hypothetical protein